VEDLWDLSLVMLDAVAVVLAKKLKDADATVSFLNPAVSANDALQLKFDIAKHILDVRVAERNDAKTAKDRAEKKQKLMEIVANKQDAELEGKTVEELTAMINAL
jgi:hypothetical protein